MRLIFFGTPKFAQIALERLLGSRHQVEAVVTTPDKPKGRGRQVAMSEVKEFALKRNLEVMQPENLKDAGFIKRIGEIGADLFCVVAFRILPEKLFALPRFGAINLHASLLPRFRGAAPIERALMAGATATGVTTFQIAKSVDTGGILLSREIMINSDDTYEDLYPRLANVGAELLVETIDRLEDGSLSPVRQDDTLASAAPKITPEDSPIDWSRPAVSIVNQIRGLAGSADAFTYLEGKRLKILRASLTELADDSAPPGAIVTADKSNGLIVAAGSGAVRLLDVCLEGKKRMNTQAFLNGTKIVIGAKLAAS
jgi:methionyl-tRNA formyltransferase